MKFLSQDRKMYDAFSLSLPLFSLSLSPPPSLSSLSPLSPLSLLTRSLSLSLLSLSLLTLLLSLSLVSSLGLCLSLSLSLLSSLSLISLSLSLCGGHYSCLSLLGGRDSGAGSRRVYLPYARLRIIAQQNMMKSVNLLLHLLYLQHLSVLETVPEFRERGRKMGHTRTCAELEFQ